MNVQVTVGAAAEPDDCRSTLLDRDHQTKSLTSAVDACIERSLQTSSCICVMYALHDVNENCGGNERAPGGEQN